jgi:NTP pyrophosphatase (non-canonical NTP hydrolase)
MKVEEYLQLVKEELDRALALHGPIRSPHEGFGILQEEVEEFFDEIKANNLRKSRTEAVQVAAVAIRYLIDSENFGAK